MDVNDHLPTEMHKYFWDINPSELDVSKRPRYVIERILEYGDFPELRWLFARFSQDEIAEALKYSRTLSRRSANFWAEIFEIPKREVKCLSKRFQQTQNQIWQR